ncbi:carbohydrate ABC transporter membrane protein 2, CUT1 family [Paenibacillus sp. UNCCL117]|uniref:carbohydrate ABC transporter permease n=1 Tax=unclassified Paenibacillus TaxID=185978 RepID=UPI000883FC05|nr:MULTISPECIES: carbohydrate ABC transporter permease [unclassified Paenibacillus]SDC13104.1 carbohydrate ABC transporter membrane protein 2, CUT1 family [Paenibacillus sp. cl123]SFW16967.1 carbohydrate ABC transporter membrane protein 2, CUT1 family [Paenibacillus sp. UNCCL117]
MKLIGARKAEAVFQFFLLLFITLFCISILYPFIHVLSISLSTPEEAIRPGIHLYPRSFTTAAYAQAFQTKGIWMGYYNTIFRTVVGTFLSLLVMTLGAYALSKKYLPHRSFYTMLIVITMFFSGGLIPQFLLVKSLGLYDSLWALIIPGLINTFYMLIMRNFFMGMPQELEDSAKMDGAQDFQILFRIILPISKPILATIGLWLAVHHWNEWFQGLIYIQDQSKIVLQIYLRRLIVESSDVEMQQLMAQTSEQEVVAESVKAAVLMIATLPILMVYPFIQKYFVKGALVGSVKG